eukprot:g5327.t1
MDELLRICTAKMREATDNLQSSREGGKCQRLLKGANMGHLKTPRTVVASNGEKFKGLREASRYARTANPHTKINPGMIWAAIQSGEETLGLTWSFE